jgi:hypothetical protein
MVLDQPNARELQDLVVVNNVRHLSGRGAGRDSLQHVATPTHDALNCIFPMNLMNTGLAQPRTGGGGRSAALGLRRT